MSIMERWTTDDVIGEIKDHWKAHFDGLAVVNSLSWRAESQGAGRFKVRIFGTVQCEQSDFDLFIERLKKEIPCLAATGAIQSKAKCVAPRASKTSKHKKAALPNYQKIKKEKKPKKKPDSNTPWRKPARRVEEGDEDEGEGEGEGEEVERGVPEDTTEVHEDPASVALKVQALAELVRGARHLVVYTGAGVSTAADIPDFRGPQGVWTLMDQGLEAEGIPLEAAVPTYTHMALVALQERSLLRHLVSQNVDGLHLRSGIAKDNLSELHGNCYVEICDSCGAEYFRDFDVVDNAGDEREPYDDHCTGRRCEKPDCYHGQLRDNIINFGEQLPRPVLVNAQDHSRKADVVIAIGTSLRVEPAASLPLKSVKRGGKLAIINLQKTPYDSSAHLRLFAHCDQVMQLLMQTLGIDVTPWRA